jgi:pimeloyl-ACP methyl ester carboxylesterase
MSDDRLQLLRLPDGRRVAFGEYGDPTGQPVVYCHGFPSSRREALLVHDSAAAEGARIIALDRPGYGDSDPRFGRTILEWPADVAAVADHLNLDHVALLGISGGGPYALACAARIPERIRACALVCPLGPIYRPELLATMHWAARNQFAMAKNVPLLTQVIFGPVTTGFLSQNPDVVEHFRAIAAPTVDQQALEQKQVRQVLNATISEAMRTGARGARQDLVLYTFPWGIAFESLRTPLQLWHGEVDGTVPVAHSRWYAAHLPGVVTHFIPGEGHYSLPLHYSRHIMRDLLVTDPKSKPGSAAFDHPQVRS